MSRPPEDLSIVTGDGAPTGPNEESAGGRRLTARGRDRRHALLEYATARFAENGFHRTSVADIVDGIGVGKGVFYWYFPSKDELLLEILRDALLDLRRTQKSAIDEADDPIGRLELGIRASLQWSGEHADVVRLVMFAWTDDAFAPSLRKGRRIIIEDTARHVTEAMESGLIEPGDPLIMATAIRGVTDELSRQYADGTAGDDSSLLDEAVRMCLYGVVGRRH